MIYLINAWMECGEARLGILSAQTGEIKHQWRLSKLYDQGGEPRRRDVARNINPGTKQLLRELFLIGCAADLKLVQGVLSNDTGDTCLYCGGCTRPAVADHALEWISNSNPVYRKISG